MPEINTNMSEVSYTQLGCLLAVAGLGYHLYYRTSKKIFKKSFLSKYTEKDALISEYHSRVLAFTTALLVTTMALIYHMPPIVSNLFSMENLFNLKMQYFDKTMLFLLFGYLFHDLLWCMTHSWHDVLNYVHHGVSIWFCITMLIVNNTAFETAIGLTLAESSNIFLHLRWFVKFFKGRSSMLFDVLFAFAFFLTRIVGGTWITYHLMKNDCNGWLGIPVRVMCYSLDVLNIGFAFQIFGMMKRQVNRILKERREKKATQTSEVASTKVKSG